MRYFSCAIFDSRDRTPTRSFIVASDEVRARVLARSELVRTHASLYAEVREGERLVCIERI
ncbi:MAG TPA: hypothetical protein VFH92_09645 [Phenylobacterium sp.]|nr:hypothetical protein [Phenylobacterium sp.]